MTNLMGTNALTVALLYKNRWVIELLFKQLKQNFELKYFLSDSENGLPAMAGDQDPDMGSLDFKPAFYGAPKANKGGGGLFHHGDGGGQESVLICKPGEILSKFRGLF